jgi:cysteine desulfurase
MDVIYLDNNATTPLLPQVWDAMRPYSLDHTGNPASSHRLGRQARQALEDARERIAGLLDAQADEILFTSGATEANNLALFGLAGSPPGHLVTSPIEHPSVAEPVGRLVARGFSCSELPVGSTGIVPPQLDCLRPDTRLITVMLANHETGSIQPVSALADQVAGTASFHCDAAAAVGKIPVSFRQLKVTSLTISAHKFHGPKGVGALVVKKNAKLQPLLWGGHQQHGKRPGTEPVPMAVGMAAALELAVRDMEANRAKVLTLRNSFLERLRADAAPVVLNGPAEGGVPHTLNLSFPGCPADLLLMNLDLAGVACSTGSACSSGSLLASPVLRAMAVPSEALDSALRFSLSPLLSPDAITEASLRISKVVNRLRHKVPSQ